MRHTQPLVSLLVLCGAVSLAKPIPTNATERGQPQIVRVSYVQGEVKLSTGRRGSPDLGKDWIAAGVSLPIEEGATLATEDGRAEVEFENGSVAYLAEHSVLQFEELTSDSQRTRTEIRLMTGTASFAHESNGRDETIIATAGCALQIEGAMVLRVESALDGTLFRIVEGSHRVYGGTTKSTFPSGPGSAFQCVDGALSRGEGLQDDPGQKAWDQWVGEQQAARKADIEKGLKESGLSAPIPGLVDLVREGTFTDCPPYGKCWEPREESELPQEQGQAKATPAPRAQGAEAPGQVDANAAQIANVRYVWVREDEGSYSFSVDPCGWGPIADEKYWVDKLLKITPEHPEGEVVKKHWGSSTSYPGMGPSWRWRRYPWATCYAGSWALSRPYYSSSCGAGKTDKAGHCLPLKKKWVVGPKRKGGSFLHVKLGKHDGFIPRHPLDVQGKRPLNAKDGVLVFHERGGIEVAKIKATPKDLKIVDNMPPGCETNWAKNLPKVEKPVIEGRLLNGGSGSASLTARLNAVMKSQPSIRYDYKAGDFAVFAKRTGGPERNERPVVFEHLSSPQGYGSGSHWGSSGGNSGSSSGWRGSGSSGGHSGGGSVGGGGNHGGNSGGGHGGGGGHSSGGGGGSYGGGGGSHSSSGGGGGSSSSSSNNGGSSSSSGSSGGGRPR